MQKRVREIFISRSFSRFRLLFQVLQNCRKDGGVRYEVTHQPDAILLWIMRDREASKDTGSIDRCQYEKAPKTMYVAAGDRACGKTKTRGYTSTSFTLSQDPTPSLHPRSLSSLGSLFDPACNRCSSFINSPRLILPRAYLLPPPTCKTQSYQSRDKIEDTKKNLVIRI